MSMTVSLPVEYASTLIRVLDPDHESGPLDTQVLGSQIQISPQGDLQIDQQAAPPGTAQLLLCKALVDGYARLCEPGFTHRASIASESRAALAAGVSILACAPETEPRIDSTAIVELIRDRAQSAFRDRGARVLPLAALSKGLLHEQLSEYPSLIKAGCVAVSSGSSGIQNSGFLRRALQYLKSFELTVLLHPLDQNLCEDGVAHDGRVAARLGLVGIPQSAETLALARDLMLIEETGVRAHISRISCARSVELIRSAKQRGARVSCDVAIANLFFCDNDLHRLNPALHVRPPLRTSEDRDALRAGLADGTIDAICSNHAPFDRDAKLAPFPMTESGASTLEALLPLSLQLIEQGVLSWKRWSEVVSAGPAKVLGIAQRDWILLDPEARAAFSAETLLSRGKNSPFLGWECQGRVLQCWLSA